NHPLETFLALVEQHRIGLMVDVRSSPYSGYAPDFNREAIRSSLQSRGVDYLFLGDLLGGKPEGEDLYDHEGHVLYDRLARSSPFTRGLERLLEAVGNRRAALLCGEEDPTDCHRRRLIGRVLGERGAGVLHIRGDGRVQTEEEVAREERFRKTRGQLTLFDLEEAEPWKSTRSVSPRRPRPSSSEASNGPESSG
ncbi:MAG TPA: DUF488 domain-containing protein, partial [Thermoguttaceae bacterium]|nr:DUF488 domain-containing protein [Thermoguttaceae bacterium]